LTSSNVLGETFLLIYSPPASCLRWHAKAANFVSLNFPNFKYKTCLWGRFWSKSLLSTVLTEPGTACAQWEECSISRALLKFYMQGTVTVNNPWHMIWVLDYWYTPVPCNTVGLYPDFRFTSLIVTISNTST
jgi:hypothetical protein